MSFDPFPFPFVRGLERLLVLDSAERRHLCELLTPSHELAPHRKLIDEGRACDQAFIVRSGWLIEYKLLRDGNRQILNFRLPGEIAAVDSLAYSTATLSVMSLTSCSVAPVSAEAFRITQRRFPRIAAALFVLTLREEAILHEWEVSLGRRSAHARVAHLMLELHRRLHVRGLADERSFELPATQQDLADCLGLTTPYVNRVLKRMRQAGLIRVTRHKVEITDAARLAEDAGFRPDYISDRGSKLLHPI